MTERVKWTERRFDFNFDVGLYPELIERLRGAPPRLDEHFRSLSTSITAFRHDERWSMQENAGHLLDLESLVQQRIDEYLDGASTLHAADMSNRKTFDANYNDVAVDQILKAFREERTKTVERLSSLASEEFSRSALHPRLNVQMRLVDMLFFQAEHDDYHLTRINELKELLTKK